MALTKARIIEIISDRMHLPKAESRKSVQTLIEIIKQTLESGEDVLISGFGKFSLQQKDERLGRNPAIGEPIVLPSRRVVTLESSGRLREKLNAKVRRGTR